MTETEDTGGPYRYEPLKLFDADAVRWWWWHLKFKINWHTFGRVARACRRFVSEGRVSWRGNQRWDRWS